MGPDAKSGRVSKETQGPEATQFFDRAANRRRAIMEAWLSGLKRHGANVLRGSNPFGGSNPPASASWKKRLLARPLRECL